MPFLPQLLMPSKPARLTHSLLLRFLTTTPQPYPTFNNHTTHCKPHSTSSNHYLSYKTLFHHLRSTSNLTAATKLHCLLVVHGYLHQNPSPVLGAQLVNTYVTLHCLPEALLIFNQLPRKNSFAWNSILRGLVNAALFSQAIDYFHQMRNQGLAADSFTYPLVLKACSGLSDLEQGREVRKSIEFDRIHHNAEPNVHVQSSLIDMFAKCGSLNEARGVFDSMPTKDLVSWGAMICGTMNNGDLSEALRLFRRMRLEGHRLDSVIVATVIPACGRLGYLTVGMGLQCCAVKCGFDDDLCVSNALIDMYCKCGHTRTAHRLFRFMEYKDVVSWSSLIAGYSQNLDHYLSLDLYMEMMGSGVQPSSATLASVLPSFTELNLFRKGKEVHNYAIRHGYEFDKYVASALVDFYCKCGSIREAEFIFEIMLDQDIAIGNPMITGYVLNGDADSAYKTLQRIRSTGLRPNAVTIVTVLPLCNRLTMLKQGKELHGYVIRGGLGRIVSVNNSMIDMYCKSGYLEAGLKLYEQMINRDIITYNTIIAAFGMHGLGKQAILFFNHMKEDGVEPDRVTFIALLSACSHAGLIKEGLSFYKTMTEDYGIIPDMEHYSCMVDLYGRAGFLDDAWDFIGKMPVEPGRDVLGSLLGACRVHKRIDLAELVAEQLFRKKLDDPGYHVLLSNIYADAGRWTDAMKVRALVEEKGLTKKPGNSWIQVGCHIHSFIARDSSHQEFDKMHEIMVILFSEMKDEGYVLATSSGNLPGKDDDMPAG